MCFFSKYKDALGAPRTGFHSARIPWIDFALWDTVGTIVIVWLLVILFAKDTSPGNTLFWILVALLIGVLFHLLFGVRTKMIEDLFPSRQS
jgi:hypothetical protein